MTLDALLSQLDNVTPRGSRSMATCPAHADKNPSLSVSEGERGILLKCWAGCSAQEICVSLGINQHDLFFDAPLPRGHRSAPRPVKIDRAALAFRYELGALDLRLRAERIIEAGKQLDLDSLNDHELDRAMNAMAKAHADEERAELFGGVADDLRMKTYLEKHHAQHKRVA